MVRYHLWEYTLGQSLQWVRAYSLKNQVLSQAHCSSLFLYSLQFYHLCILFKIYWVGQKPKQTFWPTQYIIKKDSLQSDSDLQPGLRPTGVKQCFSDVSYQRNLLKCGFRLSGSGVGFPFLISSRVTSRLPIPSTTLWEQGCKVGSYRR